MVSYRLRKAVAESALAVDIRYVTEAVILLTFMGARCDLGMRYFYLEHQD